MDDESTLWVPPPVAAGLAMVVQRLVPGARERSVPARLAAAGIAAASAASMLLAVTRFREAGTTLDPGHPEDSTTLVTDGINEFTRNPMYLGLVGLSVAHAVWRRSPWALLPAAALWSWLDLVQVPREEQALHQRYGDAYRDYCGRVPRWLGRPSSGGG